ncbi:MULTISPECIES: asparaginase [Halolamina]|uniref:L-asparaginase n=1 Tax=Halolamina pelagica TaxID=699431 RepID=A0A1I5NS91_9EURY|nr:MULTISPECIES: asparaginase [Halolamina]NHX36455.1 asparaginase [Halolamina sp. R1-12]SFP24699.1 L-asparaginase [Halolamina pelagica]
MEITVLSTGGTIASTGSDDGKTPTKAGEELIEAVPGLGDLASFTVERVASVSGFDVTWDRAGGLRRAAERAADTSDGIVVTHGTDTMAESAYLLDLTTELDVPVAFTGAQRPFDEVGTDGPPNLLAAVRTVTHERVDSGTYLVFDDEVHAARDVVKSHTSALSTFRSPARGPVGEFTPAGLRLFREPRSYSASAPTVDEVTAEIPVLTSGLGVSGETLRRVVDLDDGPAADGVVVAGTGLGNTTGSLCDAIADAREAGVPVVIASRCHEGATAPLYGGDGGGTTLDGLGVLWAGDLPAWKARIKLAVALAAGDDGVDGSFFERGLREPGR